MVPASRADLEALKAAHPLEDIVAQTVRLAPDGGSRLRGLCPFHSERTPSFVVYPATDGGNWYCFSARCARGGDVFDFLACRDGCSFAQAVATLRALEPSAGRLALPRLRPRTSDQFQRLALHLAVDLYARRLWEPAGREGRLYLRARGIVDATARRSALGYCTGWDGPTLVATLQRWQVPVQAAVDLGLLDGRTGAERFARRIIIPEVRRGRAVWMTGRHLEDVPDKYRNVTGPRYLLGAEAIAGCAEIAGDEGPLNWLTLLQWRLPAFAWGGGTLPVEGPTLLQSARAIYLPFHRDLPGWQTVRRLSGTLGERLRLIALPPSWQGQNINDVNDLARASPALGEGARLFWQCGRAALPWRDAYARIEDPADLPLVLLPSP